MLIARMDRRLAVKRPEYYLRLQPGVTDAGLEAFEARLSLKLPAVFRQLYRWRNGQAPACTDSFQDNRMFMPLEVISETMDLSDGMIGYDFDDPKYWRGGWVPFLHYGGGSYLCVDLLAEDGGQPGQLVAFWKADSDRPIEFPTLEAWLADLVISMENDTLKIV